jgi:hypothetical protein
MRLGCVVRVESTEQDLRRVVRTSLAGEYYLGISHEKGTYGRYM